MSSQPPISARTRCPCCGYLTLPKGGEYEICELCNWEDDGQGDAEADEVWGGPNAEYSLKEARENFRQYRVMYAPGRDMRITRGDSQLQYDTKGRLLELFKLLEQSSGAAIPVIETEILKLEKVLVDEVCRAVREYERKSQ